VSRHATNEALLPLTMVLIPLAFFGALLVTGSSMDDARDFGWVGTAQANPGSIASVAELIDLSKVGGS